MRDRRDLAIQVTPSVSVSGLMERGSRRPDPARLAHATVRAAVAAVRDAAPLLPLITGGTSFGAV